MLKLLLPLETYILTSSDSYPSKNFDVSQLFCPKSAALVTNPYDTPTLSKNFASQEVLPNKSYLSKNGSIAYFDSADQKISSLVDIEEVDGGYKITAKQGVLISGVEE